jgi:hypothetical protein
MTTWDRAPTADDLRAAGQLPLENVRRFLTGRGWAVRDRFDSATVWTLPANGGEFEILLPADQAARDYPSRILDLLDTVATVEERSIIALVDDIRTGGADVVSFRLLPNTPAGTIPLFNAADAVAGVRELVLASTYAVVLGRPLLVQGRRPPHVQQFAQSVTLGSPRAGSWMVSAQLPIPQVPVQGGTPMARRVSLQMHEAVLACVTAAHQATARYSVDPFLHATEQGVSANLCSALANIGRDDVPFELRFSWALQLPTRVETRTLRFDPPVIEVLRRASDDLRNVPDGDVTVTGVVSRLRREGTEGGQATVRGLISTAYGAAEEQRRVRVLLPRSLYERAVAAHGQQRQVRISGLAQRGRIERVHELEILDAPAGRATDNPTLW